MTDTSTPTITLEADTVEDKGFVLPPKTLSLADLPPEVRKRLQNQMNKAANKAAMLGNRVKKRRAAKKVARKSRQVNNNLG